MIPNKSRLQISHKSFTLYCFTPLVSLATFIIEWALAGYAWSRYRKTTFGKTAVIFLLTLGYFQFSEFAVCRLGGSQFWARSGLAAIALLPPLQIYLTSLISNMNKMAVKISFLSSIVFILIFSFAPAGIATTQCLPNFVAYYFPHYLGVIYAIWYWLLVLFGMWQLFVALKQKTKYREAILWFLISFVVLVVPTQAAYWFLSYTKIGHVSIFCGFAILTAIIFVAKVLPAYHKK